ncbi:hypothetical protein HMPREF3213_01370 [Heyndrickxia coagulans]|uniref:Uncharacterized protein n=1 Tax=Heyndrickxia coagulans TaxID=1398 RepID=A0A133KUJ7_HEYCO|nr:hypothetical protein HMPREF3213_01370 [Heyndrickxia coagulans]
MFSISQSPRFQKAIVKAITKSCSKLNKKNTNESFTMQKGGKAQTLISNLIINESATKKYHFLYF